MLNPTGAVTFNLELRGDPLPKSAAFELELIGTSSHARVTLSDQIPSYTLQHTAAGESARVRLRTPDTLKTQGELYVTVSHAGRVIARRTAYGNATEATLDSTEFTVPQGEISVNVAFEYAPVIPGIRIRVMEWNLWQGGREAGGETNRDQLVEFIRKQKADIMFILETYGTGDRILAGLNEGLSEDERFTGVRITERPQKDRDNLWIFTRFPVLHHYETITEGELTSFNFGGIKVQLPTGQALNLFNTWLWHAPWAWGLTKDTVAEIMQGKPRTYTDAEIVATDFERRMPMAKILLGERLPGYIGDDPSPILLAGDLNTLPYADWRPEFADAPGHHGLVLPWPVTQMFDQAGFTDTYRWANPDAGRYPGQTWSPEFGYGDAPGRIDYIMAKGEELRILGSFVLDERLPGHENPDHRFYSDHAAIITDLVVRNDG